MGEYWMPVNVTRMEKLHPHRFGCGLKFREWATHDSVVKLALKTLVAGPWSDDLVVIASDYNGLEPFNGDMGCLPSGVFGGGLYLAARDVSAEVQSGAYEPGPVVEDPRAYIAEHDADDEAGW